MMRIALAHKFYRLTGGADFFFRETERVLRSQGHETLMIASGPPEDAAGADNVQLFDAPAYDSTRRIDQILSLAPSIYDPAKQRRIKALLESYRPDVLHIFAMNVHLSPAVVMAGWELNIPIVGTFNDYKHICPNYKLFHHGQICYDCKGQRFWQAIRNNCCKENVLLSAASMVEAYVHKWMHVYDRFDHFTFSSNFLAEITGEFWKNRSFSWSQLLNPFDSRSHTPSKVYAPYGLYFGRLVDEKGVDRLVRAARMIDGFPIKIIGDGPDLEPLKRLAADLGATNVEFLGPRWGDSLNEILADARFVVVPSVWHENFPYVINQSFALARPVIGAQRGGIPELVRHGERGLVFDPDDIDALAAMIRWLAVDENEARRLGSNAKAWSDEMFHDARRLEELTTAYETAFDAHRRRRR